MDILNTNIYNGGAVSTCDTGTEYCSDGYSLYFPCLKDVTRGQDMCFDFYVADNSIKDVVDLRDVDSISLNLNGRFGCTYGTFSYPENIESLQREEYPLVYSDDFTRKNLCHLTILTIGLDDEKIKTGDFYEDTLVKVSAYDTNTHIFVGWVSLETDLEECPEETLYDYVISEENEYSFIITKRTKLYAFYRPRKTYKVVVDEINKHSHYNVTYKGITYPISNRNNEVFDDEYDFVNVLEGYNIKAECIPNIVSFDSESESDDDYTYKFVEWDDGNTHRCRIFKVGIDTSEFESGDEIRLLAYCTGPVQIQNLSDDSIDYFNSFDNEAIHIYTENSTDGEYPFYGDTYVKSAKNATVKVIDDDTYIHIKDGELVLTSMGVEEHIQIYIDGFTEDYCNIIVTVNDQSAEQYMTDDERYGFSFNNCEQSDIEIKIDGECIIGRIEVCKVKFIDKGKARLCLDSDTIIRETDDSDFITFEDLPSGPIYVSGAIFINDNAYGLSSVEIGTINRLQKITII